MEEQTNRSIEEIEEEILRINREYQEKIRRGLQDPDHFLKLSEIERLGRELSIQTQNLYLEETAVLLREADEERLLRKKKPNTGSGESTSPPPSLNPEKS